MLMTGTAMVDNRRHEAIVLMPLSPIDEVGHMPSSHYYKSCKLLTHERLCAVLDYDKETGIFTWKAKTAKWTIIGSVAGEKVAKNGYRYISLDKSDHLAQRLAWFYVNGEWPKGRIRFSDGDKTNCRIGNLTDTQVALPNSGFDHKTPEGRSAYLRAFRAANPDRLRNQDLKKKFGITFEEYQAKHVAQGGVCAICSQPETATRSGKDLLLAVDHCHDTGQIRDLLCSNCNRALGCFMDDSERMRKAAAYVERHAESFSAETNILPFKAGEAS